MKPALSTRFTGTTERRAAFTLTELLVIIAMVAVLFSLMLPALAGAGGRSRVAECGSNLKQFTMVLELYGMDNHNHLPQNRAGGGSWPWDIDTNTFTSNLVPYGATRDMVHCPENTDQNNDVVWNYFSIHVLGYAMTIPNTQGLLYTNINSSLIPRTFQFGPLLIPPAQSSKRVLVADGVISAHGQTSPSGRASYQYTGFGGGVILPNGTPFQYRTSHLKGNLPAGGNLGMLDGHVEWRKFAEMIARPYTANSDGTYPITTLTFWW